MQAFRSHFALSVRLIRWLVMGTLQRKLCRWRDFFEQCNKVGVHALPAVGISTIAVGAVAALQQQNLRIPGTEQYLPGLLWLIIVQQLAPLLAGFVVVGRSGSAMTAELASMKVSEEIDALEVMSINLYSFLIAPRVIACTIMVPCLTIIGLYLGLFGAWLMYYALSDVGFGWFATRALQDAYTGEVVAALIKSALFGWLISTISCSFGLNADRGAQSVGGVTTKAVVCSFVAVILADVAVTLVEYFA